MFAEEMIEADKEAELEWLRKIAACFEKGDATAIQEFGTLLHAQCAQVFPAQWALLNRCQAAAKLAGDLA